MKRAGHCRSDAAACADGQKCPARPEVRQDGRRRWVSRIPARSSCRCGTLAIRFPHRLLYHGPFSSGRFGDRQWLSRRIKTSWGPPTVHQTGHRTTEPTQALIMRYTVLTIVFAAATMAPALAAPSPGPAPVIVYPPSATIISGGVGGAGGNGGKGSKLSAVFARVLIPLRTGPHKG